MEHASLAYCRHEFLPAIDMEHTQRWHYLVGMLWMAVLQAAKGS